MKKVVSVSIATVALFGMMSVAQADIRTYRTACMSCHASGAAGAPKLGRLSPSTNFFWGISHDSHAGDLCVREVRAHDHKGFSPPCAESQEALWISS